MLSRSVQSASNAESPFYRFTVWYIPILLSMCACADAGTFAYEANSLPEFSGWSISQIFCSPGLWASDGIFYQQVGLCDGVPPPGGQSASYRRTIDEFVGSGTFFIDWRALTDADNSELTWGGGISLSAASDSGVNYRFSIARDRAELNRDNLLPIASGDLQAGVPHTYRLELVGSASYAWFIDGQLVDSGVPEGDFLSLNPRIVWRAKAAFLPNTTQWDYIRYGTIPADGGGDFDSNGVVDSSDVYFFLDCLLGPDAAGPGCRWADMNHDGAANAADIQSFVAALIK